MVSYHIMNLIDSIQQSIISVDTPEVKHTFSDGMYARTIFLKKGMFIVGSLHKTANLNVMHTGALNLAVINKYGVSEVQQLTAPFVFESSKNTIKVAFVLEDCEWTSFHPTELTDVDEITDAMVYTKSESEEFYLQKGKICLGQ